MIYYKVICAIREEDRGSQVRFKVVTAMENKQKKKSKKENEIAGFAAFNPGYIAWVIGFCFTLWGNFYLLVEENEFSWILLLFFLGFTAAVFLDAVYYIFTREEIYLVHFWGYKWRLPWFYVSSITKHGFWDSFACRELMGYEIYYDQRYKGKLIRKALTLPLTPKVKKYLNKFYCGEIEFETKRRKKKR